MATHADTTTRFVNMVGPLSGEEVARRLNSPIGSAEKKKAATFMMINVARNDIAAQRAAHDNLRISKLRQLVQALRALKGQSRDVRVFVSKAEKEIAKHEQKSDALKILQEALQTLQTSALAYFDAVESASDKHHKAVVGVLATIDPKKVENITQLKVGSMTYDVNDVNLTYNANDLNLTYNEKDLESKNPAKRKEAEELRDRKAEAQELHDRKAGAEKFIAAKASLAAALKGGKDSEFVKDFEVSEKQAPSVRKVETVYLSSYMQHELEQSQKEAAQPEPKVAADPVKGLISRLENVFQRSLPSAMLVRELRARQTGAKFVRNDQQSTFMVHQMLLQLGLDKVFSADAAQTLKVKTGVEGRSQAVSKALAALGLSVKSFSAETVEALISQGNGLVTAFGAQVEAGVTPTPEPGQAPTTGPGFGKGS